MSTFIGIDWSQDKHDVAFMNTAGTCPVTVASGKHKRVIFRQACDHEFRQIVQQGAMGSLPDCQFWLLTKVCSLRPILPFPVDILRNQAKRRSHY